MSWRRERVTSQNEALTTIFIVPGLLNLFFDYKELQDIAISYKLIRAEPY